jgi:hypothetical protein
MLRRVALVVSLLSVASCQTVQTTQGGEVGVNRKQTMTSLISKEIEQQRQQYAQLMAQAKQKELLNQNPNRCSACAR